MSGVSFQKANFLKHMNEANPTEIMHALSPARQGELLKVLNASHSPITSTNLSRNRHRSVSGQSRARSSTDPIGEEVHDQCKMDETANRGRLGDGPWVRVLQKQEQRQRRFSEVSSASMLEKEKDIAKRHVSPVLSRKWNGRVDEGNLASASAESLPLNTNRRRSQSNGSKRKRRTVSPALRMGRVQDTVQVIVDSSSSSGGARERDSKKNTPTKSEAPTAVSARKP